MHRAMYRTLALSLGLALAAVASAAAPAAAQTPAAARPLSLEEALERAAGGSENVGIAQAGVARARGDQARARSEYFPQITGIASYTRTLASQFSVLRGDSPDSAAGPPAPTTCSRFAANPALPIGERVDSLERSVECLSTFDPFGNLGDLPFGRENTYNFGLQLTQNLFTGGRVTAQTRVAGAGRRSAELNLTAQRAQLVLDVVQSYYDAVLSERLVQIAEASLRQTERTYEDTRLARQVGNQPEFELLRAQVTRDNQRPVVIQRRAQRDVAMLRLKALLNLPLEQPLQLSTPLGDSAPSGELPALRVVPTATVGLDTVPSDTATAERNPVQQAVAAVEAQEGQLTVARAQSWPQLTLTSQFAQLNYPNDGLPRFNDFVTDWTVALNLRIPLFTGGRLAGERDVARANLEEARLRLQQTRELAAIDRRNSEAQLEAAEASWDASAGTVEQADRAYQIAEIRYREGISTQTELSDSRLLLQQAQANRAQAARDLQVARVRMALLRDLPLVSQIAVTQSVLQLTPQSAPQLAPPSAAQGVTTGGTPVANPRIQ